MKKLSLFYFVVGGCVIVFLFTYLIVDAKRSIFGPNTIDVVDSVRDCPKGHLKTVDYCEGNRDTTSWMNSGTYHFTAFGVPKLIAYNQFNKALKIPNPKSSCNEDFSDWHVTDCDPYLNPEDWYCIACDRPAINGNTHYYKFAAISIIPGRGMFYKASGRQPEKFLRKFKHSQQSNPADAATERPHR